MKLSARRRFVHILRRLNACCLHDIGCLDRCSSNATPKEDACKQPQTHSGTNANSITLSLYTSICHCSQAIGADGLEIWQNRPSEQSTQRLSQGAHYGAADGQSSARPNFTKRRKLSKRVSRRMLIEQNACRTEEDQLIERAKNPPYNFGLVPACHRELRDSVVVRVTSRRMCTNSIGEMFHLCNEAARRRAIAQGPHGVLQANNRRTCHRRDDPQSDRTNTLSQLANPVAAIAFSAGEIVQCQKCHSNMKAPMRARALRCANCRAEIYPGNRQSDQARYQSFSGGLGKSGRGQATASNLRSTERLPQPCALGRSTDSFDKPLSLDYIADRLDIDNPLRGFMIRHKTGGWLQGFILVTTFTTWQRWFRWDSLAKEAGLVNAKGSAAQGVWDHDGKLTNQMESVTRSGDPENEGVIWGRIAELSLLGGLKCGRFLLKLALEELEAENEYDFLVLQATETSRTFYESVGFVRVGAVAKVSVAKTCFSLARAENACAFMLLATLHHAVRSSHDEFKHATDGGLPPLDLQRRTTKSNARTVLHDGAALGSTPAKAQWLA